MIAGHSVTLRCGQPHQTVQWYRDKSNVPLNVSGQELTIHSVSSKDEGTYHCQVDNGLRVSMKVLVVGKSMKVNRSKGSFNVHM